MAVITDLQYKKASPYFARYKQETGDGRNKFLNIFDELPENIRIFLVSFDSAQVVWNKGLEYGLNEDQIEGVARIIRGFVTGEYLLRDLVSELRTQLNAAPHVADNLANDLIQGIMAPFFEDIKKLQQTRPMVSAAPPKIRPAEGLYSAPAPEPARNLPPPPSLPAQGFKVPDIGQGNVIDLRNQQ